MEIQPDHVLQRVCGGILSIDSQVERRISKRKIGSINTVFLAGLLASDTAKLLATVVTPEPPFAPIKTSSLPAVFLAGRTAGRRTEARTKAFRDRIQRDRFGQKLPRPCPHAADQHLRVGAPPNTPSR